jgi:hypothetical protein
MAATLWSRAKAEKAKRSVVSWLRLRRQLNGFSLISFNRGWILGLSAVGIAIEVPVMVTAAVPSMVVGDLAAIAIPIAFKEAFSIMMRLHPPCAAVRWAGPVSVVPLIMVAHRVPVARYPRIAVAGASGLNPHDTRSWRRADSHSDGKLRGGSSRR